MKYYKYEMHVEYEDQAYGDGLRDASQANEQFDVVAPSLQEAREIVREIAEWPVQTFVAEYQLHEYSDRSDTDQTGSGSDGPE